ncbi:hypothetical protein EV644_13147 [Kribbella orskensis]|uniref:Uncharacterized protein n=1 Tax=Kribbella orskensis TaxID=2512216 RepID=A0ABY2B831_9ACTN|nr:hypothetical protein EV642_13347 [Kribbella sp. VKM Ac-2500]TCO11384.1 hypothetical protein EV644_13147 [Kribbella orskensis]
MFEGGYKTADMTEAHEVEQVRHDYSRCMPVQGGVDQMPKAVEVALIQLLDVHAGQPKAHTLSENRQSDLGPVEFVVCAQEIAA